MRARPSRLGHVGIVTRDLDQSVDFYTGPVGLRLSERFVYPDRPVGHGAYVAAGAFVRCEATHHCMSIFVLKEGVAPPAEIDIPTMLDHGLHHIAFEMATPEQLLDKYREMRDGGVEIANCRRGGPGNQPRFYALDPDRHLLEFYWGIDEIGWQGEPRAYPPIEEIDLEEFDFDQFLRDREQAASSLRAG
jgi:catechol 2,3-dioxygenase-like lactoylglutathione lyase family enzyme